MVEKDFKITVQKAANGFIVRINDDGEPYVFSSEDEVVDWFWVQMLTLSGDRSPQTPTKLPASESKTP